MSHAAELGARITELCSQIYAAEHRLMELIREFDEHEYWAELGLASCAHWLNFKCGIGMNAAREKVRVANALKSLPKISERFARGALSYSKVRAMTRIADETNEDSLLMIAEHGTAHHVEKLVSQCRKVKRLQEAEIAGTAYRDRELTHYYDHDGYLVIKARLPAEQGAMVVKALEMAMDRDFREEGPKRCLNSIRGPKRCLNSIQTPFCGGQNSIQTPDHDVTAVTPDREPERAPIAARRADALAAVAETYMNNSESSGSTADRYQVVVHVSEGPLKQGRGQNSMLTHDRDVTAVTSHLEDGPHVTAETSRRICCDSSIVAHS